ncbi:MAG: hypothetical protein QM639_10035 [Rhodocyclaceae bacterium]
MNILARPLLIVALGALAIGQAWAQTGLRITLPTGAVITAPEITPTNLQLRFTDPQDRLGGAGPALATTRPLLRLNTSIDTNLNRTPSVWADWRPFNNGLRTSAGMMWRDTLSDRYPTVDAMNTADLDARYRVSTPFIGFGWVSTKTRESGWRLSAEVGAYASGAGDCRTSTLTCAVSSSMGLKLDSSNDGIRWSPYLSIGASYSY